MRIEDFSIGETIRIVDVSLIKQGDMIWDNGDIVYIRDVDIAENRIEVWDKDKYLSELIYENELSGISKE
ncbi:hypothetical protein [Paenibacillus lactis]|uniref:hypothetical protein n=1 Tax=Paenibacillus lactis TaxID=228574 RepID=UPI003D7650A1